MIKTSSDVFYFSSDCLFRLALLFYKIIMVTCAAYGCTNRSLQRVKGVTFHAFPQNAERRQQWINAVRRKNWLPTKSSRLCSEHFKPEDFDRTSLCLNRIKENAVPSIFTSLPKYLQSQNKIGSESLMMSKIHPQQDELTQSPVQWKAADGDDMGKQAYTGYTFMGLPYKNLSRNNYNLTNKEHILQVGDGRMAATYLNKMNNVYDFEANASDYEEEREFYDHDSDEDTEDASETDMAKMEEYTELKEQMYQDKLASLKRQLQQLHEGTYPEYLKRLKKLEQSYKERLRLNQIFRSYEIEAVEREFVSEKKAAAKDFEEKKIELKENLIAELEEKKKCIENERNTMELTGDSMEVKPVTTRKLRRRPNDPIPIPEKRRKTSPAQLNYLLDENEILEDLKILNKGKPITVKKPSSSIPSTLTESTIEVRIDDGKLYYEKRWFHRGQPIYIESKETGKVSGVISAVGTTEILVRRTTDNSKVRIYISQLQKGKYTIRRRSS